MPKKRAAPMKRVAAKPPMRKMDGVPAAQKKAHETMRKMMKKP